MKNTSTKKFPSGTQILIVTQRILEWVGFIVIILSQPYVSSNFNRYAFISLKVIESVIFLILFLVVILWAIFRKIFKSRLVLADQDSINGIRFALILFTLMMLIPFAFQGIINTGTHQLSTNEPVPLDTLGWISYAFFPVSLLMAPLLMFWRAFDFLISAKRLTLVSLLFIALSSLVGLVHSTVGSYVGFGIYALGWILPYLPLLVPAIHKDLSQKPLE
jgi:hypothetical protein